MSISQFLLNEDRDPLPRPTRMSISGLLWNQYPEPGTGPGRSVSNNNQTGHSTMNIPTQGPANSDQGHLPVTNRAIIAPSQNIIIPRNTVRNIAPRPQIISWPEKPIDDLEAKKELKKIRKREAAARCYQRKLAKRKANSSQDKTWHIHYCTVPTNLLCGARIYSSLTRSHGHCSTSCFQVIGVIENPHKPALPSLRAYNNDRELCCAIYVYEFRQCNVELCCSFFIDGGIWMAKDMRSLDESVGSMKTVVAALWKKR